MAFNFKVICGKGWLGIFIACAWLTTCFYSVPCMGEQIKNVNSIGMEFVNIPAGSFKMGADCSLENCNGDEPLHKVTISKPFQLGKYEVTQGQWAAVMGNNPSSFKGRTYPVENVSWEEAQEFIKRLNKMEKTTRYRLPTEAEWEYAARAGTNTAWSFGDDPKDMDRFGWYSRNAEDSTHPVGRKEANAWGLHDMHGNVWEWVQDRYDKDYYANSPEIDPAGPEKGTFRINRGGSWIYNSDYARCAFRHPNRAGLKRSRVGFRLAADI